MASYKKYAEDLIGNWETGQYEPQREVTQNVYQTNWNKLINDYNTLKDKLARNFSNAQTTYANTLGNVQNESFNRMRNANIDLANRGLSSSGMSDLVTQADTQRKGQDVDRALADLLASNTASIEGLSKGVGALGQQQSSLASGLAGDLGKITKAEADSAQQYANLLAGIGEGAAGRASSRAGSKAEQETNEMKRRRLIADTLRSEDMSDEDKARYLTIYLDVPADTARQAVNSYSKNKLIDERDTIYGSLTNYVKEKSLDPDLYNIDTINALNNSNVTSKMLSDYRSGIVPSNYNDYLATKYIEDTMKGNAFTKAKAQTKVDAINRLNNKIGDYTYSDLYDILYGKK